MKQEQKNDLTSLWNQVPHINLEKYEESKVKFLEATKNLEFISSMLFYIEDEKLHNEPILYDRKYFDEINSPFINPSIENRLTKEYVMELKRKYGIEKTNKMEQSAVEWLITKLNLFNITKEEHYEILCQIELEAKEMEKKQQGYSEEEVVVLLHKRDAYNFETNAKSLQEWETPKEWFEQFKNK